MNEHPYSTKLGDIGFGRLFTMVNYKGAFIRVKCLDDLFITNPRTIAKDYHHFNDDGVHVPIVELATGHLFYMAKEKPCYIFPGEDRK